MFCDPVRMLEFATPSPVRCVPYFEGAYRGSTFCDPVSKYVLWPCQHMQNTLSPERCVPYFEGPYRRQISRFSFIPVQKYKTLGNSNKQIKDNTSHHLASVSLATQTSATKMMHFGSIMCIFYWKNIPLLYNDVFVRYYMHRSTLPWILFQVFEDMCLSSPMGATDSPKKLSSVPVRSKVFQEELSAESSSF